MRVRRPGRAVRGLTRASRAHCYNATWPGSRARHFDPHEDTEMTSSQDHTTQLDRQQVLAELEESLLQRPDLDAVGRETMLRHFEAALQDPSAAGTTGADREGWLETLDLLQRENVIASEDREALVRNFDEAMHVLQGETLKLAAEYAALGEAASDPQAWRDRRAAAAPAAPVGLPPSLAALPPHDRRQR
jgi:hypothetical protein